jgi:hypothetical protein
MLILKVEYEPNLYKTLMKKLRRVEGRIPIHVDVYARRGTIFILSLDDFFSSSFLYSAYLKARGKGLKADLMYARYIGEEWIPEDVRRISMKWISGRLSLEEMEDLKRRSITEHVLGKW